MQGRTAGRLPPHPSSEEIAHPGTYSGSLVPRWWSMVQEITIALPKTVPIVFDRYRWNRGIAESRVAVKIRRTALANVALCRFEAIVEALLSDRCKRLRRRRGRRIIRCWLWMGTSGQHDGQEQCQESNSFFHASALNRKRDSRSSLTQSS